MHTPDDGDHSEREPVKVRLSPDYSAPSPLWPSSDATDALVPDWLLARLIAWQEEFDANFHWDSGWRSDEARSRWAAEATVLEVEVRRALAGKAELTVDLWPLKAHLRGDSNRRVGDPPRHDRDASSGCGQNV